MRTQSIKCQTITVALILATAFMAEASAQPYATIKKAFETQARSYRIPTIGLRPRQSIFLPSLGSQNNQHFIFIPIDSSAPQEIPLGSQITIATVKRPLASRSVGISISFTLGTQHTEWIRGATASDVFIPRATPLGYILVPNISKGALPSPLNSGNYLVLTAQGHSTKISNAFIISFAPHNSADLDSPIEPALGLPGNLSKVSSSSLVTPGNVRFDRALAAIPGCIKNRKLCTDQIADLVSATRVIDTPLPAGFRRLILEKIKDARVLLESDKRTSRETLEKVSREIQIMRHWKFYYDLNGDLPISISASDTAVKDAAVQPIGAAILQPVPTTSRPLATPTNISNPQPTSTPIVIRTATPAPPLATPTRLPVSTPTRVPAPTSTPRPPATATPAPPPATPTRQPVSTPTRVPAPTSTPRPPATATPITPPTATPSPRCPPFKEPLASSQNQTIRISNLMSSGAIQLHIFQLVGTRALPPVRADEADSFSSAIKKACYVAMGGAAFDSMAYSFLQLKTTLFGPFPDDYPFTPAIGTSTQKRLVCVTICPSCAPQVMQGFADRYIRGWLL